MYLVYFDLNRFIPDSAQRNKLCWELCYYGRLLVLLIVLVSHEEWLVLTMEDLLVTLALTNLLSQWFETGHVHMCT